MRGKTLDNLIRLKKSQKRLDKVHNWITILSVFLGAGGIAASVILASHEYTAGQKSAALYKLASDISSEVKEQRSANRILMSAMVKVRDAREEGQEHCGSDGKYSASYSYEQQKKNKSELRAADFALVNAIFQTKGIFSAPTESGSYKFAALVDTSKAGVCAKGAANDDDLRKLQRQISEAILISINSLEKKRKDILEQLKEK